MRREAAEDDDSDSNQHCGDETQGDWAWMCFINRRLQAIWTSVKDKDKNRYRHIRGCIGQVDAASTELQLTAPKDSDSSATSSVGIACVAVQKIISALVKRRSLQTADHLVADPKADADANSRS